MSSVLIALAIILVIVVLTTLGAIIAHAVIQPEPYDGEERHNESGAFFPFGGEQ